MLRRNISLLIAALLLGGCTAKTAIPTEFPTPEPPPAATPVPKVELKRDPSLERQFATIAEAARGKVGAAAVVIETGEAAILNADGHYPMQSVYKLPITMAMADECRFGRHDLDELIRVTPADFVRQGQVSPIRDEHPEGGDFTLRELMRLTIVPSDGSTTDVLLRMMDGVGSAQDFLTRIGITEMKIATTEKEMGADFQNQYRNWSTPTAAVDLLRWLYAAKQGDDPGAARDSDGRTYWQVVYKFALDCNTGPNRIKGLLPAGTVVAHKTGTGGSQNGVNSALNDIGIIDLPNGRHLAIAVFVSDSPADEKTREAVIARMAKAAFDNWSNR